MCSNCQNWPPSWHYTIQHAASSERPVYSGLLIACMHKAQTRDTSRGSGPTITHSHVQTATAYRSAAFWAPECMHGKLITLNYKWHPTLHIRGNLAVNASVDFYDRLSSIAIVVSVLLKWSQHCFWLQKLNSRICLNFKRLCILDIMLVVSQLNVQVCIVASNPLNRHQNGALS